MSEKSSKKLVRNGQSMNNDDKKRSTEDKNSSKKNVEKKFWHSNQERCNVAINLFSNYYVAKVMDSNVTYSLLF